MRHFIGGMQATMRELTAIHAPTINSYRRYVPYSWAGTTSRLALLGFAGACGTVAYSVTAPSLVPSLFHSSRPCAPCFPAGCCSARSRKGLQ